MPDRPLFWKSCADSLWPQPGNRGFCDRLELELGLVLGLDLSE